MWTSRSPESSVKRSRISNRRLEPALANFAGFLLIVALISCRGDPTTPRASTPTLEESAQESTRIISEGTHESVTEDLLEAHRIEPYLVGNLLFIAHWDENVQRWFVYDVAGHFTTNQLIPPPGVAIPPDPDIEILNELERGKLYDFHVRSEQIVNIVEGERGDWYFSAGANFIEWFR